MVKIWFADHTVGKICTNPIRSSWIRRSVDILAQNQITFDVRYWFILIKYYFKRVSSNKPRKTALQILFECES